VPSQLHKGPRRKSLGYAGGRGGEKKKLERTLLLLHKCPPEPSVCQQVVSEAGTK